MQKYIRLIIISIFILVSANGWGKDAVDVSSINLIKESFKQDQHNTVISGLSIAFATDMLTNGAKGKALNELTAFLTVSLEDKNKELQSELQNLPKTLEITNSIWGHKFARPYQKKLQTLFNVDAHPLPKHTSVINDWIKKKTHDKIPSVLEPKNTDLLELYLVNTIYFKDDWQTAFEKAVTSKAIFHALSGQNQQVQMMHKTLNVLYAENEKLQSIKLPYKKGGFMVIYLPKEKVKFREFILNLSEKDLDLDYTTSKVSISLPKFKIDKKTDMIPLFKQLGVNEIFNEKTHDLSSITGMDAYVKTIAHRAVIEIDETGTEAAAATVIHLRQRRKTSNEETLSFIANRPFLLFITQGDFIGVYTGDE